MLVFFGVTAVYCTVAFLFWTLVPFFQTTAYRKEIRKDRIQAIHRSNFIFSPYTYAQRPIRYEYLEFLKNKTIDATTLSIFEGAIKKMEEVIQIEGSDPYQYTLLARAFEKKAELLQDRSYLIKADEHYKNALALAPQRPELLHVYGFGLVRQNRFREAIQILGTTPALDPNFPISYLYLGMVQFNLGEDAYVDVIKNLEFFFQQPPREDPGEANLNFSRVIYEKSLYYFYRQGDSPRFVIASERLAQLDPNQQSLYLQLVQLIKNNNSQLPLLEFQGGKLVKLS